MRTIEGLLLAGALALAGCSQDNGPAWAGPGGDLPDQAPGEGGAPDDGFLPSDGAGGFTVDVIVGPAGGLGFNPSGTQVHPGDTVRWTWEASGHNVVSGSNGIADGKFCSPSDTNCALAPLSKAGFVYSHRFTTPGVYPYFCAPHFGAGMKGTVTVQ